MRTVLLFFALHLMAPPAEAESFRERIYPLCEALFGKTRVGQSQVLFSGYVPVQNGYELFVRVESPGWARPKRWILLIHGLMSSHRSYDQMSTRLLEQGIGVIRLDLRGFSRSLLREWEQAQATGSELRAPSEIHYSQHVNDIIDVLVYLNRRFQIRQPESVGHSMGGGLTLALIADPRARGLLKPRATLVAPYVYRLEYRAAERMAFGSLPVGSPLFALQHVTPPLLRYETERFVDMMSEPQIRATFGVFFDDFVRSGIVDFGEVPPEAFRQLQIEFGIAAVRGLRELNSLEVLPNVPMDVRADMIFGTWDSVVDRGLARKLGRLVSARGGRAIEINAGHMIPVENPDQILPYILETKH